MGLLLHLTLATEVKIYTKLNSHSHDELLFYNKERQIYGNIDKTLKVLKVLYKGITMDMHEKFRIAIQVQLNMKLS